MSEAKKVLHITGTLDNEVNIALENYVFSTQHLLVEHYLLAKMPSEHNVDKNPLFAKSKMIHANFWHFFREMLNFISEITPNIIHLHAGYASFLGKLLPKGNYRIIHTPHCYSFEKQNISPRKKVFFMWLEGLRLNKIDIVAGCSERECALADSLGAKQSLYLCNYANSKPSPAITPANYPPFNIFIEGPLSEQKDPHYLVNTIKILKKYPEYDQIKFYWLGGGNKKLTKLLTKHDVNVSGLISQKKIIRALQKAHLYVHTSAWDGMSSILLEAAKLHIPTLVRFTPALQNIPYPFIALSPKDMAQQIIRFVREPYNPDYLISLNLFNQNFTKEKQCRALQRLYS